jgi:hypothetical protein
MTKQNQTILHKTLSRALSLARPHASVTTMEFTTWLFKNLPAHLMGAAWLDGASNLHIDARTQDHHRTLFVAHVDTVHRTPGPNKIRKTQAKWYADGAALGADDGVGCALLVHLIHAGVPAYYVFTQGEECGGIGAKHLADQHKDLLAQFDRAIAFDRRGTDSVISHQGWGRCCSDAFAQGLADAFNATNINLMYAPDDTGVYTDTAEFTDIIAECTNVSCGYYFEHSDKEELDMLHFEQLGAAVVLVDWDGLPTERDPKAVEYKDESYDTYMSKWGAMPDVWNDKDDYLAGLNLSYEEEFLYEALLDAEVGFKTHLVTLMAESVYPEEPKQAKKFINRERITPEAVRAAIDMLGQADTDTILATLFDTAYAE